MTQRNDQRLKNFRFSLLKAANVYHKSVHSLYIISQPINCFDSNDRRMQMIEIFIVKLFL